jgi:S1-C subfamily serine protease
MTGIAIALALLAQPCPAISSQVYRIAFYNQNNALVEFGGGFFVSQDRLFITARHVFEQAGRGARAVVEIGGEKRPVQGVAAESRKLDIIVVRVNLGSARVSVPRIGAEPRAGDQVSGFRIDAPPMPVAVCTAGRVSVVSPRFITIRGENFFLPGSSGSPVFDSAGQLVAVALEMVNTKRSGKPDWIYRALPARQAVELALGRGGK